MNDMIVSTETWMLLRLALLVLVMAGMGATLGLVRVLGTVRR